MFLLQRRKLRQQFVSGLLQRPPVREVIPHAKNPLRFATIMRAVYQIVLAQQHVKHGAFERRITLLGGFD